MQHLRKTTSAYQILVININYK